MLRHTSIAVTLDISSHVSLELLTQAAAQLDAALQVPFRVVAQATVG